MGKQQQSFMKCTKVQISHKGLFQRQLEVSHLQRNPLQFPHHTLGVHFFTRQGGLDPGIADRRLVTGSGGRVPLWLWDPGHKEKGEQFDATLGTVVVAFLSSTL